MSMHPHIAPLTRKRGVHQTVCLAVAVLLPLLASAASPSTVLLSDNFDANTANTFDLNVDLARQTGTLAPLTYSLAFGPGHYAHQLQNPNAQNQLLLADFPNSTSSLNQNFNGASSAGGLVISFDVDGMPALYGSTPDNWGAVNLGMAQDAQMVNVNGGQTHFGILFRAAGTLQAFDGSAVVSPSPEPVYTTSPGGMHHVDLVITDTDGNPFDGVGDTIIEVFADHKPLPVWTYRKAGGYANNYINLQGSFRAHFDNLVIRRLPADRAPVIINPSFEADTFAIFPGYVDQNGPITGWQSLGNHGVNPGSFGGPFTDNGTIPDGTRAAFLQGDGALRQVVSGFTIGATYQLRYYENARNCCSGTAPFVAVTAGGQTVLAEHAVPPVGGSNPYRLATTDPFVATATAMEVAFVKSNPQGGDTTLLIDHVSVLLPNTPPSISRHPQSQLGGLGENVTFTVVASGSAPLSYQWYLNGNEIAGATSANYTFLLEFTDQGGDYHVVVRNSAGSATSSPATLTVRASIPGLYNTGVNNDKQALADGEFDPHYILVVNADSTSVDAIVQNSAAFPIVSGPWVANTPGAKWIGPRFDTSGASGLANGGGIYVYQINFDLTGLDIGSVLITGQWAIDNDGVSIRVNGTPTGIVNNNGFGTLTPFSISAANATFVDGMNTLEFEVRNVDAVAGYTGLYVANLRGLAALAGTPPAITVEPQGALAGTGESVVLSGLASGSSPLTYQWYQNNAEVPGANTAALALNNISHAQAGDYYFVARNPAGAATSAVVRVVVRDSVTTLFNTGVDDTRTALLDNAVDPHYRLVVNADSTSSDAIVHNSTVFPIVTGPWVANTAASKWISPRFDSAGAAGGAGDAGTYLYRHTFSLDGFDPASVIITGSWATDNEGLDILINGISTGQRNTIQFPSYTSFVISNGLLPGLNTLDFRLNNASVGWTGLRVDRIRGLGTALPPNTPPGIVEQPHDVTAIVGDHVSFSVRARGSAPLSYQWFFNSDPLLDQTNASLIVFVEFPDLGGLYAVEVTNPDGSVRSREASLTVNTLPVITRQPQSQFALAGEPVTFSVQVRGAEPFDYRWFHNGTELGVFPVPTLTVTASDATAGEYLVEISNSYGVANSAPASLRLGELLPFFNTGVDDAGVALPDGSADPHYQIIVNPDSSSSTALVENSTVFPIVAGPWVANNERSKWVGPREETSGAAGGAGAAGNYTYRTTVDLTGFDPAAVQINGGWATDNDGLDILVNGQSTGQANPAQFTVLTPFSIASGLTHGVNTIDFRLNNSAVGYTGLRVDNLRPIAVPLLNTPPFVVSHPQGTAAGLGDTATLSGVVNGSRPLELQWYYSPTPDGTFTPVPNETNATLTIVIASASQGGQYRLQAQNPYGTVTTDAAALLLPNQPPAFQKGPDVVVAEDSGPQSLAGWATAISAGPPSEAAQVLTFMVTTDNGALFSDAPRIDPVTGTLTFTPAPNASGVANVSATLMDNGGTANGGVDHSAPQSFSITVTPVNDCPTVAAGSASTQRGAPVAISLVVTDIDTDASALTYAVSAPGKGALSGTAPNLTYTPAANACGADRFTVVVSDGQCQSAPATISITIVCPNPPPVAVIKVSPLADFSPELTDLIVISPNDAPAKVFLDGSRSNDPDGGLLAYAWSIDGQPVATGAKVTASLETGVYEITLVVTDPQGGTDSETLQLEVISPAAATEFLASLVESAPLPRVKKRALLSNLTRAVAAFEDGRTGLALSRLRAFQHKARLVVGRNQGELARRWSRIAQMIIDAADERRGGDDDDDDGPGHGHDDDDDDGRGGGHGNGHGDDDD